MRLPHCNKLAGDSAAVEAVVKAWTAEGRNPRYHQEAKRQLHRTWPTLANALEQLAAEKSQQTG